MQGCKKVVSIQDISGLGRCSLTVVIPVLSAMGIQVCPVPTAVLSAHTGYSEFVMRDLTDFMKPALEHYKKMDQEEVNNFSFDISWYEKTHKNFSFKLFLKDIKKSFFSFIRARKKAKVFHIIFALYIRNINMLCRKKIYINIGNLIVVSKSFHYLFKVISFLGFSHRSTPSLPP